MPITDRKLLCDIAHQYYNEGHTQAEIARMFGLSRTIVSRKIAEARECGIVKIFIDTYEDEINEIEQQLSSFFNLKGIKVASVPEGDTKLAVEITAKLGGSYLSEFLEPDDRIGFGWGWTLFEMSKYFPKMPFPVKLVCQLTGSVDNAKTRGYANEIISNMSRKLNAESAYTLPCPVLVDSKMIADTLQNDLKISQVMANGRDCNKLFVNIALPDEGSCLYHAGYLDNDDLKKLIANQAIGSLCCRFFNRTGNVCDAELDARTMGITIADIHQADCVLACITGRKKAKAVYTALKANLIDVLVIDSLLAKEILSIAQKEN